MKAGRLRWLAKLKSEGKRVPAVARRAATTDQRQNVSGPREAKWLRDCQRMAQRLRTTNRKALREQRRQQRQVAADLAMRRERFRAGLPFLDRGRVAQP
jgi:hypothetical protein